MLNYSLWNERASYFDESTLSTLLFRFDYKVLNVHRFQSGFFMVWRKVSAHDLLIPHHQDISALPSSDLSLFEYGDSVVNDIVNCSSGKHIAIFGTGHKGITLAQKISALGFTITLYDGNTNKVGSSIANLIVRNLSELTSNPPHLMVLAVSPSAVGNVTTQVLSTGYLGPIVS